MHTVYNNVFEDGLEGLCDDCDCARLSSTSACNVLPGVTTPISMTTNLVPFPTVFAALHTGISVGVRRKTFALETS
jgi:hypothetical protein